MTRRRWIADRVLGDRAWLTGTNAAHLAKVLRAKEGQQFDILESLDISRVYAALLERLAIERHALISSLDLLPKALALQRGPFLARDRLRFWVPEISLSLHRAPSFCLLRSASVSR